MFPLCSPLCGVVRVGWDQPPASHCSRRAQDHARIIMPHLEALSGSEGADGWIHYTTEILNACSGETLVARLL